MSKESIRRPKSYGELVYSEKVKERYRRVVDMKRSTALNRVLYPALAVFLLGYVLFIGAAYMKRQGLISVDASAPITLEARK